MRRFTWIALSFFLITATIAITAQVVRAQIIFPDATVQDTAFTSSGITVAPGATFVRTFVIQPSSASATITADLVPTGKELVVLKLVGYNVPLCTLDSRLPSPNQNTSPVTLAVLSPQSSQQQFQMEFPAGTVIVAEGRQPWLVYRNGTTFAIQNSPAGLGAVTLIGYLRNKA